MRVYFSGQAIIMAVAAAAEAMKAMAKAVVDTDNKVEEVAEAMVVHQAAVVVVVVVIKTKTISVVVAEEVIAAVEMAVEAMEVVAVSRPDRINFVGI